MEIHQWLPGFATGDAVSNEAIAIRNLLRGLGYKSEIFCVSRHISPKVRHLAIDYKEYSKYSNKNNIVIYHFSIGSEMTEVFRHLPDKKIVRYHNITPDRYFRYINDEKALVLHKGREELYTLKDVPDLALGVSEFNRKELEMAGFKNTAVLPILMDLGSLGGKFDRAIIKRYRDKFKNIVFVGRLAPNKKIEDIIKIFYYYKNTVNISSRLVIIGSFVGMDKYYAYLHGLVREMNLSEVIFTGHVKDEELRAYYRIADLCLCMSEHEGFCVPLLESMYFGIPIVAYESSAVPETLDGVGVLVKEKNYPVIAELIGIILENNALRKDIVARQKRRLEDFSPRKVGQMLINYIREFTNRDIYPGDILSHFD